MVATLSTVDFYGEYSYVNSGAKIAVPIAFEAKETLSRTSFPLANIHQHQLEYLKLWTHIGGDGFFIVHFKELYPDQAFITPVELIDSYWNSNKRKSIPITDFDINWLADVDDYLAYVIAKKL